MSKNKPPGPGIWPSIIIGIAGISLVAWGVWAGFNSAFELLTAESFATPGTQSRDLDPGTYEIYALSGEVSIFELDATFDDRIIEFGDIAVTNLDTGAAIPIEPLFIAEGLGRNSNIYDSVAQFEVVQEGRYEVAVSGTEDSFAVFGASFDDVGGRIIPWLIMGGIGSLLFLIGAAMLIVGMVRRNRKKHDARHAAAMTQAPAGYTTPHDQQPAPAPTNEQVGAPPPPPPAGPQSSDATPWD